jgi:hypothetical protein
MQHIQFTFTYVYMEFTHFSWLRKHTSFCFSAGQNSELKQLVDGIALCFIIMKYINVIRQTVNMSVCAQYMT